MHKNHTPISLGLFAFPIVLFVSSTANAEFVDDSTGTLSFRNFFLSRDFRSSDAPQSRRQEWAQGIMFQAKSGYTDGPIGVGADLYATLGLKLDSSDAHAGTGLLPNSFGDSGPAEYTDISGALKARISNSQLMVGGFQPKLPILWTSDVRLLPPLFNGVIFNSTDIDDLTLETGRLSSVNYKNSSANHDKFLTGNYSATSDRFDYGGMVYKANSELTVSAWTATLDNVYQQYYAGATVIRPVGEWVMTANIGYFKSTDDGLAAAGEIESQLLTSYIIVNRGGHALRIGYQYNSGDSAFPYLQDTDPFVANGVQILDFTRTQERSRQIRYDYDFAALGAPGLIFFARYARGDGYQYAGREANEWERDLDISYVVQSGPLKNFAIRWRNASVRSESALGKLDENRLILSYMIPFK